MRDVRFSDAAIEDLDSIYQAGVALFGVRQADRYQDGMLSLLATLADHPGIAGPPLRIAARDVYRCPYVSHVIF